MEQGIIGVEDALLLDATASYADEWDQGEDERPWADEFSVPAEDVEEMTPEIRLAYAGRLARSLALQYVSESGRLSTCWRLTHGRQPLS